MVSNYPSIYSHINNTKNYNSHPYFSVSSVVAGFFCGGECTSSSYSFLSSGLAGFTSEFFLFKAANAGGSAGLLLLLLLFVLLILSGASWLFPVLLSLLGESESGEGASEGGEGRGVTSFEDFSDDT